MQTESKQAILTSTISTAVFIVLCIVFYGAVTQVMDDVGALLVLWARFCLWHVLVSSIVATVVPVLRRMLSRQRAFTDIPDERELSISSRANKGFGVVLSLGIFTFVLLLVLGIQASICFFVFSIFIQLGFIVHDALAVVGYEHG